MNGKKKLEWRPDELKHGAHNRWMLTNVLECDATGRGIKDKCHGRTTITKLCQVFVRAWSACKMVVKLEYHGANDEFLLRMNYTKDLAGDVNQTEWGLAESGSTIQGSDSKYRCWWQVRTEGVQWEPSIPRTSVPKSYCTLGSTLNSRFGNLTMCEGIIRINKA